MTSSSSSSAAIPILRSRATGGPPTKSDSSDDENFFLGRSLPSGGHHTFVRHDTTLRNGSFATQDDIAVFHPVPRASLELLSKSAKQWAFFHKDETVDHRRSKAEIIMRDFSKVAHATNEASVALQEGKARAERPPRPGVCGTYFIRSGSGDVLCVFKPMDEEANDIDWSPPSQSPLFSSPSPTAAGTDFSLGPAHNGARTFSFSPPDAPLPNLVMPRNVSAASDDDAEPHTERAQVFISGEGGYKEVAAYLLDNNFAGVPQTALATCQFTSDIPGKSRSGRHILAHSIQFPEARTLEDDLKTKSFQSTVEKPLNTDVDSILKKVGALQVFVKNVGDADDFGPGVFDKEQVHRIAILDIRTLNHDRHTGNILVTQKQRGKYNVVPIDHGYILPDISSEDFHSIPWPVWMDWPMVKQPLSPESKEFIDGLDPESEASILQHELEKGLRPGSLHCLKIATIFLQMAVAAGLTLYEIGLLMYPKRENPSEVTELVKVIREAQKAARVRRENFWEMDDLDYDTSHTPVMESLHRRHQSMSALRIPSAFIDEYVVKYAVRRLREVIQHVVDKKEKTRSITRSRSSPNFGMKSGVESTHNTVDGKPLHLLSSSQDGLTFPTPAVSPIPPTDSDDEEELENKVMVRSKSAPNNKAPLRVSIDDGTKSITMPELRASPVSDADRSADLACQGKIQDKDMPGKIGDKPLPPSVFNGDGRNTSPVAPQEMAMSAWDSKVN